MTKHARGEAMRGRILAELRRRRDAWEPEPTLLELAALFGTDDRNIRYHLRLLREAGMVHPGGILVTRQGYGLEL